MKHKNKKHAVSAAKWAVDVWNKLTCKGKAEALSLKIYGDRMSLKEGRGPIPPVYESLFYGDVNKYVRSMNNVIDIIAARIKKQFGAAAEVQFRQKISEAVA